MGLFGDDERQDARLDALREPHPHADGSASQQSGGHSDLPGGRAPAPGAGRSEISAEDVDPALAAFNDDLSAARKAVDESTQAASQSWAKLQERGSTRPSRVCGKSLNRASERLQQESS